MFDDEYGGEPYDVEDTPRYWTEREMERMIVEEERERRARYAE